ncbi:hypothetical protein [Nocardioides albertanoniae]|uniref:hypothetical protein n=1 Tax=Nocardioides albertanoniae TaxID=1175486 RepID=UPI0011501BCE|nr:hypothetical protein [Nocardioides albertanoniae]
MGPPGTTWCDDLAYLETTKLSNAAEGATGEQYVLDNGDVVGATVFVPGGGDYPDAGSMLAAIDAAVDKCLAAADKGDYGEVTSEPISGLPDGAVGFKFTNASSDPVEVGSVAFAETDDGRLAGVGVTHYGSGKAPTDVVDLLSTALERAGDVPSK